MRRVPLTVLVFVVLLAGCVGNTDANRSLSAKSIHGAAAAAASDPWIPKDIRWDTSGKTSKPLADGPYKSLAPKVIDMVSFDGTKIESALWLPDVPPGTQVPVVLEVGPYFDPITDPLYGYWGDLIVQGILPHGYAYVQVAVRGTAGSGGCQEFLSLNEQKDIDKVVTFYATQPWSNGNVALIGISYDGTTPYIAATFGNPHVKTIVPMDGLSSYYDTVVRNGSAWALAPAAHAAYWSDGWTDQQRPATEEVSNTACPEGPRGLGSGAWTTLTGEKDEPPIWDGYWAERDFKPRILENYHGSIFLVTGLLDWRVPIYQYFPFMTDAKAKGIETKMLLGQWWHDMPDDVPSGRTNLRWDFAEVLLRWFDHYLYGRATVSTGPAVDVEDSLHGWRTEAGWPPRDANWTTYSLGDGTIRTQPAPTGNRILFGPASAHRVVTDRLPPGRADVPVPLLEFRASSDVLASDLRIAGQPRLHITFTPTSPEGNRIYAELRDRAPDGTETFVGQAIMDLRFYQGGTAAYTLTPGTPIKAKMEFVPLDAHILRGHQLVLVVTDAGYSSERLERGSSGEIDQGLESPTPSPVRIEFGGDASTLSLPLIDRDVGDGKYPGQP